MESRVLPDDEINGLLTKYFVCLEVGTDKPPADVEAILREVHGVGRTYGLPSYICLTPEGKVVRSTTGYRSVIAFKADLEAALKSESIRAAADVEKKVAEFAEQAAKDFEARKYGSVLQVAREAHQLRGWCEARAMLRGLADRCEEFGRQALEKTVGLTRSGSFDSAAAAAKKAQADFPGSEIERAAGIAVTCIERLQIAAKDQNGGDMAGARSLYESIVKEAADSPYKAIAEEKLAKLPK